MLKKREKCYQCNIAIFFSLFVVYFFNHNNNFLECWPCLKINVFFKMQMISFQLATIMNNITLIFDNLC